MIGRGAFVLLMIATIVALPQTACATRSFDIGGGLVSGGYLGELRHDWRAGVGGMLYVQTLLCCDVEGRLSASMQWNDGSMVKSRAPSNDPDLGALPGDRPRTFRRATYAATVLWRLERLALGDVGLPYVGVGGGTYERVVRYAMPNDGGVESAPVEIHEARGWDLGIHAVGGLRLYRTSGMYVALEGAIHGIDTPNRWTTAYNGAILVGIEMTP